MYVAYAANDITNLSDEHHAQQLNSKTLQDVVHVQIDAMHFVYIVMLLQLVVELLMLALVLYTV